MSILAVGGTSDLGVERKLTKQSGNVARTFQRPQSLKNGGCLLVRPAPAYVVSELPFDVGSTHRPLREPRCMVHLVGNALTVKEDSGDAGWHGSFTSRREDRVFGHLNLLHE